MWCALALTCSAADFYRMILPAKALQQQGHDVVIIPPGPDHAQYGVTGDMRDDEMVDAHVPEGTDVVVMQRVSHQRLAQAIPILRRKGVTVVIDVDDDLQHIHPSNPAFAMLHPRSANPYAWKWCFDACRDASMVTVSTPALLPRYAPHGRGRVLYNAVPALFDELAAERRDSDLIGWGGTVRSHPDDLQAMGGAVRRLGRRFHVVGPSDGVADALGVQDEQVVGTGTLTIQQWPVMLARLGVGTAPLSNTRFNSAKSHLKILEMSGLGVPWVASGGPEYKRLHAEVPDAGLIAQSSNEWYRHLKTLATDPVRRAEMSAAGRALAAAHTVEGNAWRWAEAWTDAYKIDHASRPTPVPRSPLGLPT